MTLPEWIVPMAATLTQKRFTGPEWSFEQKLDGIRLLAFKQDHEVRLLSRNRLPQHSPAIANAIIELPAKELILDGEMTWRSSGVAYHLFDMLWLDGRDLRSAPLEERRARLSELPLREPLKRVPVLNDPEPWERALREGWEGVIAKRAGSLYEARRSPNWLKMKCEVTENFLIGGFTDPKGSRVGLGALLLGFFERDDFVFVGRVGTGFDRKL